LAMVALGRRWPSPLRYWLLVLALAKFAMPPLLALPTGFFSHIGPVVTPQPIEASAEWGNAIAPLAPPAARSEPAAMQAIGRMALDQEPSTAIAGSATNPKADSMQVPAGVASSQFKTWLFFGHLLGSAVAVAWILYQLRLLQ